MFTELLWQLETQSELHQSVMRDLKHHHPGCVEENVSTQDPTAWHVTMFSFQKRSCQSDCRVQVITRQMQSGNQFTNNFVFLHQKADSDFCYPFNQLQKPDCSYTVYGKCAFAGILITQSILCYIHRLTGLLQEHSHIPRPESLINASLDRSTIWASADV